MRSDARRNYERILVVASAEVALTGADASLEKIARDAGVGSATLHRHFPTRQALLEAVFHDRVEVLCAQARDLTGTADPGRALIGWLRSVADYGATTRGLAASLLASGATVTADGCEAMLTDAGGTLLRQAQAAGEIRPDIAIIDLLTMVNAVSLATQDGTEAVRLVSLALDGIHPTN
ncbi:TetR/AcrR family transcriptional regulator [Actinoplanes derwentensis]|uniref:Regulatory protein, tetR family n=1 Tax=Actinoplanes derwentensis TaxID=113562 RepID=A0A1H1WIE2_9ACTN|nr:TetR/AcrR family transcriptional regulator [Actinoplanes derwentensis]GID87452.1 TetR family transcriptional regulator [Actinoplanes derwentensis]SDS97077.1 regulatory protein, tetR family [Actinoplanes derwentensis]